jgi:hypothetical protein
MATTLANGDIYTDTSTFTIRPNGSFRFYIDSVGNIFYGGKSGGGYTQDGGILAGFNTSQGGTITIVKTATADAMYFANSTINAAVGRIQINSSSTSYVTTSDYRVKENVVPMTGALEKVAKLNPVTFTWKVDGKPGEGFIAHELQEVCPEAVAGEKDAMETVQVEVSPFIPPTLDENGNEIAPAVEATYEERVVPAYQGVDTSFLVATLAAAIQELKAELDAAKARIETLEANQLGQ